MYSVIKEAKISTVPLKAGFVEVEGWRSFLKTLAVSFNHRHIITIIICLWFQPSNCIGRWKLSQVHIKPHAMTRAMTFDKGLPESEVAY